MSSSGSAGRECHRNSHAFPSRCCNQLTAIATAVGMKTSERYITRRLTSPGGFRMSLEKRQRVDASFRVIAERVMGQHHADRQNQSAFRTDSQKPSVWVRSDLRAQQSKLPVSFSAFRRNLLPRSLRHGTTSPAFVLPSRPAGSDASGIDPGNELVSGSRCSCGFLLRAARGGFRSTV